MKTLEKTLSKIREYADNPFGDVRVIDEIGIGQAIRQGDLYLVAIESIPDDTEKVEVTQLAPGNTLGSRHTVGEWVEVFKPENYGQVVNLGTRSKPVGYVVGYLLRCSERFTDAHPEHSDFSMPTGCYQIRHQLDSRSMRAVQD